MVKRAKPESLTESGNLSPLDKSLALGGFGVRVLPSLSRKRWRDLRGRAAAQTPEERTTQARRAVTQRWKKAGAEDRVATGRMLAEARKKAAKTRHAAEASDKSKARPLEDGE